MSRRKHRSSAPAVRFTPDVSVILDGLLVRTGWSASAAVGFLATAGWNALHEKGAKIIGYQKLMLAAVEHHELEVAAKKKLAAASAKLRDAKKALEPSEKRR